MVGEEVQGQFGGGSMDDVVVAVGVGNYAAVPFEWFSLVGLK